jgi:hypothetical protein
MDRSHLQGGPGTPGSSRYEPTAIYFMDSDCVEYVKEDCLCVYERVDNFLTLILDETEYNVIGFKLKGFKCIFEKYLKPLLKLTDEQFLGLVPVLEIVFTALGNGMFSVGEEARVRAYKAAIKLAANDNVKLWGEYLKAAA